MSDNGRRSHSLAKLSAEPLMWQRDCQWFQHEGREFVLRPLEGRDADDIAELYRIHYPSLWGSQREQFHSPDFFRERVALAECWDADRASKDYMFVVIEELASGQIIYAAGYAKDDVNRSVQGLAVCMNPAFRGKGVVKATYDYFFKAIPAMGIDYFHGTASARDVIAQKMALNLGLRFGGIMPGCWKWSVDGEHYYRDMLIYMYRYFNGSEAYATKPDDWRVLPELLDETEFQRFLQLTRQEETEELASGAAG